MPSALERAAARFRRELLNNERAAASAMVRVYGEAWQRVDENIRQLRQEVADAESAWIQPRWELQFQIQRQQSLKAQIEAELRRFAAFAEQSTLATQTQAVEAAGRHAAGLVDLAAGGRPAGIAAPFDVLPTAALQDLIGFASDGSPLRDVFEQIAPGVAQRVTDTLAASLAAGMNPRETARLLRRQFGTGLARALTISRTETLRAYREAMHRNYEANDDVIDGWVWLAKLDTRTCAACWAMHGSEHSLDERLNDHLNGRCTAVPKLKPWRALGVDIPDRRPVVEPGPAAFERLPDEDKARVLGKAAFAAYQDGAVTLDDFAVFRRSDAWGDTLQAASLEALVGRELAQKYIRAVREALRKRKSSAGRLTAS